MRRVLLLAAAVITVAPAEADDKAEVKAVIDKSVKAHGGAEALSKFKMTRVVAKGTISLMGNELEFDLVGISEIPDKFRNEIKLSVMGQKIEIVEVSDGKKAWVKAMGNEMELEGEQLEEKKEQAFHNYLESIVPLAKDKDLEITAIGEEMVDGKPAAGLKIMKKGMKEFRMYFDKASGLLVKASYKARDMAGQEVDTDSYYRNYKDVQGVKQPMTLLVKQDGKKFIEAEVSEIKLGEKAEEGTFKQP
jgi:hypothetical protein